MKGKGKESFNYKNLDIKNTFKINLFIQKSEILKQSKIININILINILIKRCLP